MRKGLAVLVPLAALLSACWESDSPLIPDAEADRPKLAGKYDESDDLGVKTATVTISAAGATDFELAETPLADDTSSSRLLRLDRLSGDWYLVQSNSIDDFDAGATTYYRILKITRNRIEEYEPACGYADTRYDGVSESDGDCTFTDYEGLRQAAANRVKMSEGGDGTSLALQSVYTRK